MKLRYTEAARQGLWRQIDWLAERSPAAARGAAAEIDRRLLGLLQFPYAAPSVDDFHREAFVDFGRDGFHVLYRIEGEYVLVVRILHGRQNR